MSNKLQSIVIILPIVIIKKYASKKAKRYYININQYRNWHYLVSGNIKKMFKDFIADQLNFSIDAIHSMQYQLVYNNSRRKDKMNYISIIDKFFMDALTECGCIPDDSDEYVGDVLIKRPLMDKKLKESFCKVTIKYYEM